MQRFLCPPCGHTVSVLPANRLPYRPWEVGRLEGDFDAQAEVGTGLDLPPEPIEAGCLQRAWNRFLTRVQVLQDAFGQILPAELHTAQQLWQALWRGVGSAEAMLRFHGSFGKFVFFEGIRWIEAKSAGISLGGTP